MSNRYPMDYLVISRMANAHILEKADSFVEVARDLFGVQAQIQNAAAIAYCLRLQNGTISQYFKQYEQMKLVRLWGIRTTLHSYCYEDWNLVLSQVSLADNWFRKKMIKQGCDLEPLVQRAVSCLQGIDVFDRDYLIQKGIPAEYLGPWGDFLIELNNRGIICHNTSNDIHKKKFINATKYVSFNTNTINLHQEKEKKEIARRYFGAFSPATIKDFAHWLGCTITQAKSYLALIQEELIEVECNGKRYYILNIMKTRISSVYEKYKDNSECWLLSKFDPLLLAYDDKSWIVDSQYQNSVWKSAGHVEGVIVKNWKAIGTWKYSLRKGHIGFELFPFCKSIEPIDLYLFEKFKSIACYMECNLDYIRMN